MFYTEIAIASAALIIVLYYAVTNLAGKGRSGINMLFSVTCLIAAAFFASSIFINAPVPIPYGYFGMKVFIGLGLFFVQMTFHLTQFFPRWESRPGLWFFLLSFVPGFLVAVATIGTDYIFSGVVEGNTVTLGLTRFSSVYFFEIALYGAGFAIVTAIKARRLVNPSFKFQMNYLIAGYCVCLIIAAASWLALPAFSGVEIAKSAGAVLSGVLFLVIFNYAISADRTIDLVQHYRKIIGGAVLFLLLSVPVFFIIHYSEVLERGGNPIPTVGVAFLSFLYLFIFYRFGKPAVERFFKGESIGFEAKVGEFFQEMSQISHTGDWERFWGIFFEKSIFPLETRFAITRASFHSYDQSADRYFYSFGFGEKLSVGDMGKKSELVECLTEYGGLIDISFFFTDERLASRRESVYDVLRTNGVSVVLPFFNFSRELIGIMFLGELKTGKPYTVELLHTLEVYRIQFELALVNAIMLEDIKHTQVSEHDKLVLKNIKGKIIPRELATIEGIRLSTLYVDNSEFGGDYFDSVMTGSDSIGIFICNTADAGVESGLLSLELYSVLHNDPQKLDTPDKMLNAMNWVVSTSRFSEKYVQAFYMIYNRLSRNLMYSSAAFNPCVLFDMSRDVFSELDTKGIPLGVDKNFVYEMRSIKIVSGGFGFIHSDGLISAMNKDGSAYSSGRIKDMLRLNIGDSPAVLARKLHRDFTSFTEGQEMMADVSVVLFRID